MNHKKILPLIFAALLLSGCDDDHLDLNRKSIHGLSNMSVFNPEIGVKTCTHDGTMKVIGLYAIFFITASGDIGTTIPDKNPLLLAIQPDGKTGNCPKGTVITLPYDDVEALYKAEEDQQRIQNAQNTSPPQ